MEPNALKQQFSSLQEQQQKKLAKLKARKASQQQAKEAKLLASQAFGVNDDLDLKLAEPPDAAESSVYSEELVNHLNDQIRQLKDESGRLYKLLSERDFEIQQMKKKLAKEKTITDNGASGIHSDAAALKIVELSKKIREMTAELESERTKSKQLMRKCSELENKSRQQEMSHIGSLASLRTLSSDASSPRVQSNELKSTQEKLRQSEMKLTEQRNQNQSLRQEMKMLQKVITQEVGENVSIQSLLNGSSGWRGRAQQIIALQKKVNELKSQLSGFTEKSKSQSENGIDADLEDQFMGSATSRYSSRIDERGRETVKKIERERKEAYERTAAELKALEQDHEALKSKLEASKARNKVLSNELKATKQQLTTLMDKGKHDDELISALLKQQEQLKASVEANTAKQKELEEERRQSAQKLNLKSTQESHLVQQLKSIVAEKEAKVQQLEQDLEETRRQKAHENSMNALFERCSSRPTTSQSHASVIAEIVDDISSAPTPLPQEEGWFNAPSRPHSAGRTSPARKTPSRPSTANNLALEIDELKLQCQEYKTLCQAATVEREKLSELVQVLEHRVTDLTVSSSEAQSELVSQRKRNVQLEKQLGKVKVEQGSAAGKRMKSKNLSASAISLRESVALDDPSVELEELQVNLEIQRDENDALKAALQSTLQSKQEDNKLYHQMMEETKAVFLHSLRLFRQGQS